MLLIKHFRCNLKIHFIFKEIRCHFKFFKYPVKKIPAFNLNLQIFRRKKYVSFLNKLILKLRNYNKENNVK